LKNKVQTKEFNFTNGNMGVETGSKSVITLNLSRIIQDWAKTEEDLKNYNSLKNYLYQILDRVYLYHVTYNELLWDMYDANLLSVYKAGFIDLNKQYLTIGINGLNQSAEFLGISCTDNPEYEKHCQEIFGMIKEFNEAHKGKFNGHQITLNTECVPAESLAIKNYNWDKEDGYWVPEDTNLYASYIYKPNDKKLSVLEKIRLHGSRYIGDYLDGGSAAHINLSEHLSTEQYERLIKYAADEGCQYFTWNIPNCECDECGYIAKQPFKKCPKCESTHVSLWDRIIGYLTRIDNWSEGRQIEQKTRVYSKTNNIEDIND
jgi:ribonucleoside-triphosphate reductase